VIVGYVKTTWAADIPVSVAHLNHLETQYDEAISDIGNHDHDADYYTKAYMVSTFWNTENVGSESGCDADTVGGYHAAGFSGVGVPSGLIILWYGAVVDIPAGWYLCNGANGTPNLQDRFIVGAGGSYAVGNTGGSAAITPTGTVDIQEHILTIAELPIHHHVITDKDYVGSRSYYAYGGNAIAWSHTSTTKYTTYVGGGLGHDHEGTFAGNSQENRPPFHALCWIQKS